MIIYISGPITGTKDYKERFAAANDHLLKLEHKPINPVAIGEDLCKRVPTEPSYEAYLMVDLAILEIADAVYMLKGFEESNGARIERMRAAQRGKRIFYQGDSDSEKLLTMGLTKEKRERGRMKKIYECDPNKNTVCKKPTMCGILCFCTSNPLYSTNAVELSTEDYSRLEYEKLVRKKTDGAAK